MDCSVGPVDALASSSGIVQSNTPDLTRSNSKEFDPSEWTITFAEKDITSGKVFPVTRIHTWESDLEMSDDSIELNPSKITDDKGYILRASLDGTQISNINGSDGLMIFFARTSFESDNTQEILDQIDERAIEILKYYRDGNITLPEYESDLGTVNIQYPNRTKIRVSFEGDELKVFTSTVILMHYATIITKTLS